MVGLLCSLSGFLGQGFVVDFISIAFNCNFVSVVLFVSRLLFIILLEDIYILNMEEKCTENEGTIRWPDSQILWQSLLPDGELLYSSLIGHDIHHQ